MFRFADPWFFLLLALIPAAIRFRSQRPVHPAMTFPTETVLRGVRPSFFVRIRWIVPAFLYGALVLMIAAAARPQWGTRRIAVETEGVNIVLAIDLSESMAALDFKAGGNIVNRLEAVRRVVADFIEKRTQDRIGMVVFGTEAYTQLPLTRDTAAIDYVLQRLEIGAAGPKTAIGDALGISVKRLSDVKSRSNVVILLTDGQSNAGELSPEVATRIAVEKGVKVYTIGVGTQGMAPFLIRDPVFGDRYYSRQVDMDEGILKTIADRTGGLYFRAENTEGLAKVYETIDALEKTRMEVDAFAEYREFYPYAVAPALVLLALAVVLSNTRLLRVP